MVQGYQSGLLLGTPSVSASSTRTAVSLVPVLLPPGELFPLGLWVSQICVSPSISAPPPISPSFFASSVLPPAPSLFPHLPPTLSVWLLFLPDPHLSPASQTCLLSGTGALSCCPLQVCPHPPGCVTGMNSLFWKTGKSSTFLSCVTLSFVYPKSNYQKYHSPGKK